MTQCNHSLSDCPWGGRNVSGN